MKPLIGITTYFVADQELQGRRVRGAEGQDMLMSNLDYSRNIHQGGGIPVALPILDDQQAAEEMVERLDGLLLAGGEDLEPALFDQQVRPGLGVVIEKRDRYEWALVQAAMAKNIPILGVCRGFQLLNAYFGGTLHQDLATYFSNEIPHASASLGREALVHEVAFEERTFLRQWYGEETLWVNSLHHQGVDKLGSGLLIAAKSADGLVEGFQHRIKDIYAVQWHPEMMADRFAIHRQLFRFFVDKAGKKAV